MLVHNQYFAISGEHHCRSGIVHFVAVLFLKMIVL